MPKNLKLYYYDRIPNFGDMLNVLVFSYYGFNVISSSCSSADAVGIGSILGHLKKSKFSGVVLGAGLIEENEVFNGNNCDIWALRGPLTLERVKGAGDVIFGDLGLLVSQIIKCDPSNIKKNISIVPHYVDLKNINVQRLLSEAVGVNLIDVTKDPATVLSEISSSKMIITSSLHGLIAADSYGIPVVWVSFSDDIIGGEFKFKDYLAGLGYSRTCIYVNKYHTIEELAKLSYLSPQEKINDAKYRLDKMILKLSKSYYIWKTKYYMKKWIRNN